MKLLFRGVFFLFIFILASCKKDKKDAIPPTISVISPVNTPTYRMFDTIPVSAHVSDNMHLSSITVTLTDMNHTPVQGVNSVPISSADFVFNTRYILTEFRLQSGNYILQITADDGYNAVSSFQPVYIIESPTKWLGYCFNLKSSPQFITGIDSSKNSNLSIPITGAYNGMKYSGYNQQLYINGSSNRPFIAYDMQNGGSGYQVTATPNQVNYMSLNTDGYKPYIGFKNGDLYSYTNTGIQSTSYRYTGTSASYPYYFANTGSNNVAVYRNIAASPTNNDVLVTFSTTGATFGVTPLAGHSNLINVIGIFEKATDSLYVLGNDAGNNAIIYIYQPSTSSFLTSYVAGMGTLLSTTKVNNQYIIFSTTTGIYGCSNFSTPVQLQATIAQKLIYQSKLSILVAATSTANASTLSAYTYTTTGTTSSLIPLTKMSLTLSDSLVDFELITNK